LLTKSVADIESIVDAEYDAVVELVRHAESDTDAKSYAIHEWDTEQQSIAVAITNAVFYPDEDAVSYT
jgi:hypothetical protein